MQQQNPISFTCQLDSKLEPLVAIKRLTDNGFMVTESLTFAPNLFAVESVDNEDIVSLSAIDGVLWAEVNREERLGPRV